MFFEALTFFVCDHSVEHLCIDKRSGGSTEHKTMYAYVVSAGCICQVINTLCGFLSVHYIFQFDHIRNFSDESCLNRANVGLTSSITLRSVCCQTVEDNLHST